jgi:hypothetical protein
MKAGCFALLLCLLLASGVPAQDLGSARLKQAERLAERFRIFLGRALPHFNFIEADARSSGFDEREVGCAYDIIATHNYFTDYSFDLGPLAGQVWSWLEANRAQLKAARVCRVRLSGSGTVGYWVDSRQQAIAKRIAKEEENERLGRTTAGFCDTLDNVLNLQRQEVDRLRTRFEQRQEMVERKEIVQRQVEEAAVALKEAEAKVVETQARLDECRKTLDETRSKKNAAGAPSAKP